MKSRLIAQRYASGLSAALDTSALDRARAGLNTLAEVWRADVDLHRALTNPTIPPAARQAIVAEVARRADAPPEVARLMQRLLERGRIGFLPEVAAAFTAVVDARLNRTTAQVTTALPLNEAQQQRVQASLARRVGKTLHVEYLVDPEILGGVSARIGGLLMDGSVRTRMERMARALLSEGERRA